MSDKNKNWILAIVIMSMSVITVGDILIKV
jgi:hypothetical protein